MRLSRAVARQVTFLAITVGHTLLAAFALVPRFLLPVQRRRVHFSGGPRSANAVRLQLFVIVGVTLERVRFTGSLVAELASAARTSGALTVLRLDLDCHGALELAVVAVSVLRWRELVTTLHHWGHVLARVTTDLLGHCCFILFVRRHSRHPPRLETLLIHYGRIA